VNLRRLALTTRAQLQMTFRNRVALFWALAFPMILLGMLGLLFGHSGNGGTVVVVDNAQTPSASALVHVLQRKHSGVSVRTGETAAEAIHDVKNGNHEAALVLTRSSAGETNAHLYYSNASAEQAGIIRAVVSGAADGVSIRQAEQQQIPAAIAFSQGAVDSSSLDYLDFLLPGIIAIAIMTSSVFGVSTVMVDWRKRGILRRLKLTPMPLGEFLTSRVFASLVVTVMQLVVLLIFGRVVFGIHIASGAWLAIPVALIGALTFLAFGFFIGSIVANPETADAVSNAITLPMMFLSGAFVPIGTLPTWLAAVAKLFPLYYLADGLRKVTVRGLGLEAVAVNIAVLVVMALVFAAISLRTFQWEPGT
jgi:ABC-2 type transport system permease protein